MCGAQISRLYLMGYSVSKIGVNFGAWLRLRRMDAQDLGGVNIGVEGSCYALLALMFLTVLHTFLTGLSSSADNFETPYLPGNPLAFPVHVSAAAGKQVARMC